MMNNSEIPTPRTRANSWEKIEKCYMNGSKHYVYGLVDSQFQRYQSRSVSPKIQ